MNEHADADEQRKAFELEVSSLSAQICALRRKGLTPKQIRAAIPQASPWAVNAAINRDATARAAHPGLRARAKDELREKARELRLAGMTYKQIRGELGSVSNSSLSLWLRDLPYPEPDRAAHAAHMQRVLSARTSVRREGTKAAAFTQIGEVSDRELFLLGVGLYWAEGTKDKPYCRRERVVFVNSDAGMIRLFAAWLDLLEVEPARRSYRVAIHESADLDRAEDYWRGVLGLDDPGSAGAGAADVGSADVSCADVMWGRANIKRHNPKTSRKNVGDDYHGCLVVSVLRGADLYRRIEGWWRGIVFARAGGNQA